MFEQLPFMGGWERFHFSVDAHPSGAIRAGDEANPISYRL